MWRAHRPDDSRGSDSQFFLTSGSIQNAAVAYLALGGSTNAAVHLVAMARRANIPFGLEDLEKLARRVPVLANVFPAGRYLMDDFFFAGGLHALLSEVKEHLDLSATYCTGQTMGDVCKDAKAIDLDVIRTQDNPVSKMPGLAVLRGNLAPMDA